MKKRHISFVKASLSLLDTENDLITEQWRKKKTYSLVYLSYPERIHQAQAAAAKARKALQQKPKPAAKPVSPQEKKQTKTQQHLLGEITIYQLLF